MEVKLLTPENNIHWIIALAPEHLEMHNLKPVNNISYPCVVFRYEDKAIAVYIETLQGLAKTIQDAFLNMFNETLGIVVELNSELRTVKELHETNNPERQDSTKG